MPQRDSRDMGQHNKAMLQLKCTLLVYLVEASLQHQGSDPYAVIEPGPQWWETDRLTSRPPEHLL